MHDQNQLTDTTILAREILNARLDVEKHRLKCVTRILKKVRLAVRVMEPERWDQDFEKKIVIGSDPVAILQGD